uniref:Alpha 1,4-glycosyltransferase domain-containing protein n=1 Tax=Leptobrachium leishanense TaxID=445787 RepID=A0A8C5M8P3_9ANUR
MSQKFGSSDKSIMLQYAKYFATFLLALSIWHLYMASNSWKRKSLHTYLFHKKNPINFPTPDDVLRDGNGIIFLEITDRLDLPPLVLCSVESAARVYPDRPVAFFMQGLPDMETSDYQTQVKKKFPSLSSFQNVYLFPLRAYELFTYTPLLKWYTEVDLTKEKYRIHVTADGCRLAFIWKYGGIYFDSDTISMRPIPHKNFLAAQSEIHCANGMFGLNQYHGFAWICMEDFVKNYDGNSWGHQGPQLFTRILKYLYGVPQFNSKEDITCGSIHYLHPRRFFPIPYMDWERYYEVVDILPTFNDSYSVHLWNFMSNTLVDRLFQQYCPTTHAFMLNNHLDHD